MIMEHIMSIVLVTSALVAFAIGVLVLFLRRKVLRGTALMAAVQTTRAARVTRVKPWNPIEVKGILRCTTPLTAPLSKRRCAYYDYSVIREYEEAESDGKGGVETHRHSETVESGTQQVPFLVQDPTGTVQVNPAGAQIDGLPASTVSIGKRLAARSRSTSGVQFSAPRAQSATDTRSASSRLTHQSMC